MLSFGRDEPLFGNVTLEGNIGVRFVHTDVRSAGALGAPTQDALGITQDFATRCAVRPPPPEAQPGTPPSSPGGLRNLGEIAYNQLRTFASGEFADTVNKNDYGYFLPSLNLKFGPSSPVRDCPETPSPPVEGFPLVTRRGLLVAGSLAVAACATGAGQSARPAFVRCDRSRFLIGGRPYRYAGANMWYAAYLGADAPFGDRDRLKRELDLLLALGIDNVRILGSSELSPLKNSVTPAFRDRGSDYNETLLLGLDFALMEMGKRNMRAVIYLTNFWEWSGGMMTYLYWTNGGRYINMNDPVHPWPEFADMTSQFYASAPAVAMYHDYVRAVVTRTNRVTGVRYADDPAIMCWQLANEPRPGGSEVVGSRRMADYLAWISGTASLVKSLDANHLVSTGSEGTQGCLTDDTCVANAHSSPDIDYVTAHIWPQNWSWADPQDLAGTWPTVEKNTRDYIARQAAIAAQLGKPLVIEEFGFPRDGGSFDPEASTTFKDRFYSLIYGLAEGNAAVGGTNFWAWSGEGRASHSDRRFQRGDTGYVGDPPHEPQGWYGVFDSDASTQALIRAHAAAMKTSARLPVHAQAEIRSLWRGSRPDSEARLAATPAT